MSRLTMEHKLLLNKKLPNNLFSRTHMRIAHSCLFLDMTNESARKSQFKVQVQFSTHHTC